MRCFKNSKVIMSDGIREGLLVICENGKIIGTEEHAELPSGCDVTDAEGKYLSPGFIDIHVHGGGGYGVMSGEPDDIFKMCRAHNLHGTTSVLPTTLAAPVELIRKAALSVKKAMKNHRDAGILGVHLEGPFLSPLQCGAQNTDSLVLPDEKTVRFLLDGCDCIKMVGAAPELAGGYKLGKILRENGITASIAHSDATFEQVEAAISHGYSDVTHIYSGCSSVIRKNGYRIAGVVEAGLYFDGLTAGVIADMRHLPQSLLRYIYKCKTADGMYLMTDGLEFAASELEEGKKYTQKNGIETVYEDGVMKLMSRQAFAGSVATMNVLVRNMYKNVGVSLCDAVKSAAATPARVIGEKTKGKIAVGYDSDIILFDDDINVSFCMIGDSVIKQ